VSEPQTIELTAQEVPLVRVEKLGRIYDVSQPWLNRVIERTPRRLLTAAVDVSFTIAKRETFALVGESGSGKSTVAKMAVGLVPPSSGDVSIDGVSMFDPRQAAARQRLRRRIQMIFQDPYASLNPRWRAADIIAEPLRAFGLVDGRRARTQRIDELLRLVGLGPEDGAKYPHEFSGGQRQRIAIARALSSQPEFIVCDEPTSALDVSVQAQILNLMRDLQAQFGLTYLFISHNLAVVRHMAARIGVMYLGRLVEVAPSTDLFARPRHPYTRMLLDAVPDLDLTGRARKTVEGEVPNPINPPAGCPFHPRCPFAFERCRAERPLPLAAGTSLVACHGVEEGRIPAAAPAEAAPGAPAPAIDPAGGDTYTGPAANPI
jgi:peptide/nickel transport system ATP-binding protein